MSTRTHFDSEGKSVTLTLTAAIEAREAVYVNGWLGVAVTDGASGDNRAITIAREEYQFQIPNALDPAVGACTSRLPAWWVTVFLRQHSR
jgi:predicted RecA/RadA family phage recombinase